MATQQKSYDADAELWQNLSGAAASENPYLPFLQPKVIERDGKRFLRIPKNQELMKLGEFFDTTNKTKFSTANELAKTYLDFLQRGKGGREDQRLALDTAKAATDRAKATSAPAPYMTKDKFGNTVAIDKRTGQVLYTVPTGATTSQMKFQDFLTSANLESGGMSRDPRIAYQDYLEAQQQIDSDPSKFSAISKDPRAAPFAHLLKPKATNDLFSLFSEAFNNFSIDTNQ